MLVFPNLFVPRLIAFLALGTLCLAANLCASTGAPQASNGKDSDASEANPLEEELPVLNTLWNRKPGFALGKESGQFFVRAWLRAQLRYSDPFDSDPLTVAQLESPPGEDFEFRRARIKAEGHLFSPKIGFYYEQSLLGDRPLLDLRLNLVLGEDLQLRVGQFKALYNRERVDSSGKQQFVERSIATYPFTVDRQRGVSLASHFAKGSRADSWLMAGIYQGDGRDPGPKGDEPMYMLRWQWQFMGREVPFSQSDFAFTKEALGSFSLAAARVRGPYTRFSTSGGGQLDGFEMGGDERYTLEQWQQGFAWKHRGFSVQQEYHQKRIEDHESGRRSKLQGGYAQAGKAWPVQIGRLSFPMEVAFRYAQVEWKNTPQDRTQKEFTIASNLYLSGHEHKFTADVSRLSVAQPGIGTDADLRFRLQWDISF